MQLKKPLTSDKISKTLGDLGENFTLIEQEAIEVNVQLAHKAQAQRETLTVKIPNDYPTLQEAVDKLSEKKVKQGVRILLNIESGHQPSSGIVVGNGDYSHFVVRSTESVVTVALGFTGDFIQGINAHMPVLGCLVDMGDKGSDGYSALYGSNGYIDQNCGIKNAGQRGIYLNGSYVYARRCISTGNNNRNVWVTRSSRLECEESNFDANKGGDRAVYVSRASMINMQESTVRHARATEAAIQILRSFGNCENVNCAGNILGEGLRVTNGSSCNAQGLSASDAGSHGISVGAGSVAVLIGANANDCQKNGILVSGGSRADCNSATFKNNKEYGVQSSNNSNVSLRTATVTGNIIRDLGINFGSSMTATDTTTTNSIGGQPVTANTNVGAFNVPDANRGILWV